MIKRVLILIALLFSLTQAAFAAIDINSAGIEELDKLKGIGPVKAKAIVDYRAKNGPFKSIEDIKNVNGIGDATFEGIKNDITVSGGSGLRPRGQAKSDSTGARKSAEAGAPAMGKGDAKKDAPKSEEAKKDAKKDAPKSDDGKKDAKKSTKKEDKPEDKK